MSPRDKYLISVVELITPISDWLLSQSQPFQHITETSHALLTIRNAACPHIGHGINTKTTSQDNTEVFLPVAMDLIYKRRAKFDVLQLFRDIFQALIKGKKKESWSGKSLENILKGKIDKNMINITYNKEQRKMKIEEIEEYVEDGNDMKFLIFLIKDLLDFSEQECLDEIYELLEKDVKHQYDETDDTNIIIDKVDKCYTSLEKESKQDFKKEKEEMIGAILKVKNESCKKKDKENFVKTVSTPEGTDDIIKKGLSELDAKVSKIFRSSEHPKPGGKNLMDIKVKRCIVEDFDIGIGIRDSDPPIEEREDCNFNTIFESLCEELAIIYSSNETWLEDGSLISLKAKLTESVNHVIFVRGSEVEDDQWENLFKNNMEFLKLSQWEVNQLTSLDILFLFEFLGDLPEDQLNILHSLLKDVVEKFECRKHIVITDEKNVRHLYDFMIGYVETKLYKVYQV
ncbi:uncharacterized protein LOC143031798 isoform X1 [Oratosquilla oratoria]|uniref:uncharacterized protein LOC143031798 isoform X1 n=2 Tax=Oratosquilla oratoria TaxID=337810 RepID=UPI003F7653FD